MAKRFTDTDKFIDPWFRRLSRKNKLLWDWLLCNCDHAGIITVDLEFVEMVLSEKYEDGVLEKFFSERIIPIAPAKYFIPKFIRFQYGKLNPESKVHASVIQKLREAGIIFTDGDSIREIENNARVIGYGYPMDTTKEKDKNKAKDKVKDKEEEKEEAEKNLPEILPQDFRNSKDRFTPDHVADIWNRGLGIKLKNIVPSLGTGKHAKNCIEAITYLPDSKAWEDLFKKTQKSEFLMGNSRFQWKANLFWLVDYDNAVKVLTGVFDNGSNEEDLFSKIKEKSA